MLAQLLPALARFERDGLAPVLARFATPQLVDDDGGRRRRGALGACGGVDHHPDAHADQEDAGAQGPEAPGRAAGVGGGQLIVAQPGQNSARWSAYAALDALSACIALSTPWSTAR